MLNYTRFFDLPHPGEEEEGGWTSGANVGKRVPRPGWGRGGVAPNEKDCACALYVRNAEFAPHSLIRAIIIIVAVVSKHVPSIIQVEENK